MRENRTGIMGYIVEQDGAGTALGAIAAQLRSRKPELISQCPRQCLLLHDVDLVYMPVDVQADEMFASGCGAMYSASFQHIARRRDGSTSADDSLDESAP